MQDDPPRLTRVYHLINGQVAALDQNDQHMPEFEGHAREAIPKILAAGWRQPIMVVREIPAQKETAPEFPPGPGKFTQLR